MVFFPLMVANASCSSRHCRSWARRAAPEPVLGHDDQRRRTAIFTAPHLAIVPGLMIVLTVLALNVFGDGVRDALDPRAKIRLEH